MKTTGAEAPRSRSFQLVTWSTQKQPGALKPSPSQAASFLRKPSLLLILLSLHNPISTKIWFLHKPKPHQPQKKNHTRRKHTSPAHQNNPRWRLIKTSARTRPAARARSSASLHGLSIKYPSLVRTVEVLKCEQSCGGAMCLLMGH